MTADHDISIPYLESRAQKWMNGQRSDKLANQPQHILCDAFRAGVLSGEIAREALQSAREDPHLALMRHIFNECRLPQYPGMDRVDADMLAQDIMGSMLAPGGVR
ncbi:MAG: hypothetical protein V4621_01880 [Pseudomonadota bacterium]